MMRAKRTFRHDLPVRDAPPPRRLTLALALRPVLRVHGAHVQKLGSHLPGHVGGRGDSARGVRVARRGFAHGPVRGARGGWRRPRGFGRIGIGIVLHGVEQRPRRRRFRRRATAEGDEEETPPATGASGRTRRGRGVGGGCAPPAMRTVRGRLEKAAAGAPTRATSAIAATSALVSCDCDSIS